MAKTMISPLPEHIGSCDDQVVPRFKPGILDVRVHEARGIHNICIYGNQDVFAKFSFTHGKGESFSTTVVAKGGTNPVFNESFQLPVTVAGSVLKCEMWMSSRAHSYLEDQLLGFVLVPLSSLIGGKDGQAEDYGLSSTELFHSPAGTVRLTVSFREGEGSSSSGSNSDSEGSQAAQSNSPRLQGCPYIKVFEDGASSEAELHDQEHFSRGIEFADLQAASEDQKLVSDFLQQGHVERDIIPGPTKNELYSIRNEEVSPSTSGTSRSSITSDEQSNSDASHVVIQPQQGHQQNKEAKEVEKALFVAKQQEHEQPKEQPESSFLHDPQVVQQQIVDMYMKSMQQFTEALAKMQLPLDLDKEATPNAKKSKSHQESQDANNNKTNGVKSRSRVFYGSRAFF